MPSFNFSLRNTLAVAIAVTGTSAFAASAAPPRQLLGKSVIITWSETRQQRAELPDGRWTGFGAVNASHKLSFYISDRGRVFSRQVNTTASGSGTNDQIAGGPAGLSSARTPLFSGLTMTVISEGHGGARQTKIEFDAGFTNCTARVERGFERGKTDIGISMITKRRVEIRSVDVGAANCIVQVGNVFGASS
jgi:hypothetical protein